MMTLTRVKVFHIFAFIYLCQLFHISGMSHYKIMDKIHDENIENILSLKPSNVGSKKIKSDFSQDRSGGRVVNENAAHGFEEHDIVVPIRIHHVTGHPVSHGRHFRKRTPDEDSHVKKRRRRDLGAHEERSHYQNHLFRMSRKNNTSKGVRNNAYYDVIPNQYTSDYLDELIDEDDAVDHRFANFSLQAFGEKFSLHLTPYQGFLAPNYTLHYMGDPKDGVLHPDGPHHCFYSGFVNGREDHTAVLSVCRGLFGAFRTDTSDYLIQPEVSQTSPSPEDEEGTKTHRIFRRSIRKDIEKGKELCGFTESTKPSKKTKRKNKQFDDDILNNLRKISAMHSKENIALKNELLESQRAMESTRRWSRRIISKQHSHFTSHIKAKELRKTLRPRIRQHFKPAAAKTHSGPEKVQAPAKNEAGDVHSRRKRFVSYPRNVEVMVTADNAMLKSNDDVEHYVLTLMAIVHHVYSDPSIENLINIVLVKLVVVGDTQIRNGPKVDRDAHTCLRNFCEWQFRQNDPDDSHPNHHDTAVLITGQDICRSSSACDTLGLAELGTMCDQRRSCSINEDNGLSTAFTIAHEIGHEFNAPHDNHEKCFDASGNTGELNVMSPTLDNNAHPWKWSKCSAKYITSFLDNGNSQCLLDEPPQRVLLLPIEEPGEVYDANAQCSFVYGKGVNHCNFMFQNSCARLWCVSQNISHGCRTPHVPWADGTRCGDRSQPMWCQRGQCVPENRHRVPVDGGWGEWSRFEDCSRTCGGGIKSAVRECNNPKPQHGGRYCTGKRKKFRPCNSQECSVVNDFRAEQCAEFNDWSRHHRHRIRGIAQSAEWIPKYDGILLQDRCKLICQVKSDDDQYAVPWYVLKPKVIDGTPCGPDTNDICVEGICKTAGCDHVLDSRTTVDSCGVCNGDNSSCRAVQGSYNAGYKIGYHQVVVIPSGANNIVITQTSHTGDAEDNNYLALRDTKGNYMLNGNRSVMKNKHRMHRKSAGNSRNYLYYCDYSGTDNVVERINCTKVTGTDLVVEVLSAGDLKPPNINYRYNIPIKGKLFYKWIPNGAWSPCSLACNGKTKRKTLCVRSDQQVVSDGKCQHLPKPSTVIRPCNTKCRFMWHPKPSQCSVRCGTGSVDLEFECRKIIEISHEGRFRGDPVAELASEHLCPRPYPGGVSTCQGECLLTSWNYGEWSECSRSCGDGSQTRTATCHDSKGAELSANECESSERVISRSCGDHPCPQWTASSFSQCTASCGQGLRHRNVQCRDRHGIKPDSACSRVGKPPSTMNCLVRKCPEWRYQDWEPCSATCGEGTSIRNYECVDYLGRRVDKLRCDRASLSAVTRVCSAQRLCDLWDSQVFDGFSAVWKGLAERGLFSTPAKVTSAPTTTTTTTTRRPTTTAEDVQSFYENDPRSGAFIITSRREVAQWRTGSWTPCSATCGQGERMRYVSCRHNRHDAEVSDDACGPPERKPPGRETCQVRPCHGKWITSSWSQCTATCVDSQRFRRVRCAYAGSYRDDDVHCTHEAKPAETETCPESSNCTTTTTTTTATTPTTATTTTKRVTTTETNDLPSNDFVQPHRSPVTSHGDGGYVISLFDDRPIYGQWRSGPWSQCSRTCGGGTQKRAVVCQPDDSADTCDTTTQPSSSKLCNAGTCPQWKRGKWGECSRTCGGGTRSRRTACFTSSGRITSHHHCDDTRRPVETEACKVKSCPREHRWRKSVWSSCSTSCGRGLRSRQVKCVNRLGQVAADEMCAHVRRRKPREVRRCMKQRRCPRWRVGTWNQCSATCGTGIQVRRVNCRYKKKVIVDQLCDGNKRPDDLRTCNTTQCSTSSYSWKTESWSSCSKSCGEGFKTRRVTCLRVNDNRTVGSDVCDRIVDGERPHAHQACNTGPCSAYWNIGVWSECSDTCGPGIQRRPVTCSYVDPITYSERIVNSCDALSRPYNVRDCDRGSCNSPVYWRVGSWSECSATCGVGSSVRRVVCTDRATQSALDDAVCQAIPSFRPDRKRKCRTSPCVPTSCQDLKTQRGVTTDGEYSLKVKGKMLKVYCKDMLSSRPSEYITLVSGERENFSEIYGYRLISDETCPYNGTKNSNCACHRDHPDEGYTSYSKVRFDVATMRVITNDFSFASTSHGKSVPFGVAGDCYSRNNCPQGNFQINLQGTGLAVSTTTRWRSYGMNSVRRTHRSHSGDVVAGTCGGYCSRCQADPLTGLLLDYEAW